MNTLINNHTYKLKLMFMNTKVTTKIRMLMLFFAMLSFAMKADAQTYQLSISNETLVDPQTYQFDVYLKRTGATPFELANVGFGLGFDVATVGAGTLTFSIVSPGATFCEFTNSSQYPTTVTLSTATQTNVVNTVTYRYMNIQPKSNPGAGSGSIMSATGSCPALGTRVGRFQLSNTVPFVSNTTFKHIFSTAAGPGRNNTVVSAYVGTTATNVNVASSNLGYNVAGTCLQNIVLNFVCPTITLTPAAGALAGGTTGTPYVGASVTASGGTAPYTYTITGGALPAGLSIDANTGAISGTPTAAGNATFTVTATASGTGSCTGSAAYSINVVSGCNVSGSAVVTDPSCFGGTGSAVVTLTGTGSTGAGSYTVDGNPGGSFASSPFTVSGLTNGNHTIVASVGTCVSSGIAANVVEPVQLSGTASGTSVSCFGSTDGSATVTLSTSTSGTYTVDGNGPFNYNSNPFTVNGLGAGNHTFVATSAAGCVSSNIGVSIGDVAALTGSGTTTATTCGGGANGTATITLSSSTSGTYTVDGNGSFNYSTNPFTVTGLSAGPHTIVATATAGCVSSNIPVTVGGSATFSATFVKTNLSRCNVTPDGTITITPTGGVAPYTYSWTGETGSNHTPFSAGNVSSLTGLNYGYYTVVITDAGGCGIVTLSNIHIEIGYQVSITNSGSVSSTCANTGSLIFFGAAGLAPYQWSLTSATTGFQSSNTFTGLAAGTYTVWVKDNGGCVNSKDVTVGSAPAIVVSPFATGSSACGSDGSIQIFRTGGIPGYTYSITSATGPWQASNSFTGLAAGPYTAYVKDAAGCVGSAPVTVAAGAGVTVGFSKVNTSSCAFDGSIQVNAAGGTAPYTYSKDGGTTFQASNSFTGLGAGNYAIVVKDFKGCTGSTNVIINLNTIVVTATPTAASTCTSNNGKIQLFRTGGYGPYTYSLDGNTYQSSNVFLNVAAGTYTGYVKDAKTCIGFLSGIVVGPTGCVPGFTAVNHTNNVKINASVASAELKVQAYPNPSNTDFTLLLQGYDSKTKVSITVTDLLGRKVYQTEGTGKLQYRLGAGFMPGVYNVQVIQGTDKKSLKLVKE